MVSLKFKPKITFELEKWNKERVNKLMGTLDFFLKDGEGYTLKDDKETNFVEKIKKELI